MSRLPSAFADGPAFIPYLVAGDPSPGATAAYAEALAAAGADAIELGLPFSEPVAEGPTIQRGIARALSAGMTPARYFELVDDLAVSVPLVCMTYYNLIHRFDGGAGPAAFVERAADAGIDGLIVADLPVDEAGPLVDACRTHDRDLVFIVAPTTTPERLDRIRAVGSGFVYVQARLGTTGARRDVSTATRRSLARLEDWPLPKAVGFGIASGEQARQVIEAGADGAIVGSALVETVGAGHTAGDPTATVADRLERQAASIADGVARASGVAPAVTRILNGAASRSPPSGSVAVDARSLEAAIAAAASDGRVPLIAEVKRTSPTTDTTHGGDAADLARSMVAGGAAAISVLTEEPHFGGTADDLTAVRAAVDVPVLRKDFILEAAELDRVPADSVLLIARFLDDLDAMVDAARDRGMEPLVEVHTADELDRAVDAGATLIGVNNRDLLSLEVDLATAAGLLAAIPDGVTRIAESGITSPADARRMLEAGADGLLVGTALMGDDPTAAVDRLVRAGTEPTVEGGG